MQYADEVVDAPYEVRVYMGADAEFLLYEDAGDGYGYEQGEWATVRLTWTELEGVLRIEPRSGEFPGMVRERVWNVLLLEDGVREEHALRYCGDAMRIVKERR